MSHDVKERFSKVHFGPHVTNGPRVEVRADVVTAKTVHTFRCVCNPEDDHDHETEIAKRAAMIERHDAVIDGYAALVGREFMHKAVLYKITDCKMAISPGGRFDLRIGWDETHVGQEPIHRLIEDKYWSDEPDNGLPKPDEVLGIIEGELGPRADALAKARVMARAHARTA